MYFRSIQTQMQFNKNLTPESNSWPLGHWSPPINTRPTITYLIWTFNLKVYFSLQLALKCSFNQCCKKTTYWVEMGGDSCSEGHRFESQQCLLDGHFSHIFVVKFVMFVWKYENKRKIIPIRYNMQSLFS